MQKILLNPDDFPNRIRYPFADLRVGGEFIVKGMELEGSIRSQASKHNKNGKLFIVQRIKTGKKPYLKWSVGVKRLK